MYESLIGEKVIIIVSSRGENLLEYTGTLLADYEDTVELANVDIAYLKRYFWRNI